MACTTIYNLHVSNVHCFINNGVWKQHQKVCMICKVSYRIHHVESPWLCIGDNETAPTELGVFTGASAWPLYDLSIVCKHEQQIQG